MMQRLLLFFAIVLSQTLFAQFGSTNSQAQSGFDSTGVGRDSSRINFGGFEIARSVHPSLRSANFSLNDFQFYLPVYSQEFINSSLGNNGNAIQQLNIRPEFSSGFDGGFHAFDAYMLSLSETKFYDAQSPYTEAFYVQGSKEEAFFNLKHTQNVGRALNFGLEYKRVNSAGYYQRQTAQHSALRAHFWFRPGKERYQVLLSVNYHKGSSYENGGITEVGDSLFQDGQENNRQLYPVNLAEARTDLFRNGIQLLHFYDFNKSIKDSTDSSTTSHRRWRVSLNHHYRFIKQSYLDADVSNPYYSLVLDSLQSLVTYQQRLLSNEFSLHSLSSKSDTTNSFSWDIRGFLKQESIDVGSNFRPLIVSPFELNSTNLSSGGDAVFRLKKWLLLDARVEFFIAGFNAGDARIFGQFQTSDRKQNRLIWGIDSWRKEASFQLQNYVSNFSVWQLDTKKIAQLRFFARAELSQIPLEIEVSNRTIGNWVYLDQNQHIQQSTASLNLIALTLNHQWNGKRWHLHSSALLQHVSGPDILRVPLIQFRERIFREGKIGNATPWRIGIDFVGCTSFYANAYLPQASLFYLQDGKRNRGLLNANIYVSAKIKRARVFVMLDHANTDLFGPKADIIPFQPLPDRLLKIGLSWVFFD